MEDQDFTSERRILQGIFVAFFLVTLLAGADVVTDLGQGTTATHAIAEIAVVVVGLLGSAVVARRLLRLMKRARAAREEIRTLQGALEVTTAEAQRWRNEAREHLSGLSIAIDRQFERWALSPAEKEVAMLLLKGLSHKELAEVRSVTEATARQQARALYKKAGVSGRSDLAAFFLEDLLVPSEPRTPGDPRSGIAEARATSATTGERTP